MKRNILLWGLVPLLNTFYQTCIKLAASDMDGMDFGLVWLKQAAITPWMWAALISEIAAFIIWMQILSNHNLSKVFPLSAIGYVLVLGVSWFLFHEAVHPLQLLGGTLILTGVWMIGTAEKHQEVTI